MNKVSDAPLIDSSNSRYELGVPAMDKTHLEFIELVNQLATANKAKFMRLFTQLEAHTEMHFCSENALMEESAFPASREHMDEHQRVLGDLNRMSKKVASGSITFARAYVTEQLPEWFDLHTATMDSALAAHIKSIV